jgi:hypothetical protein
MVLGPVERALGRRLLLAVAEEAMLVVELPLPALASSQCRPPMLVPAAVVEERQMKLVEAEAELQMSPQMEAEQLPAGQLHWPSSHHRRLKLVNITGIV